MTTTTTADLPPRSSIIATPEPTDRLRDLNHQITSLRDQIKDATAHALVTIEQAENQHLSRPSLHQRAHGTTLANEPPGIYHLYWKQRSLVRERHHRDEVAVAQLRGVYEELRIQCADAFGGDRPQDGAMLDHVKSSIFQAGRELEGLEGTVNSR